MIYLTSDLHLNHDKEFCYKVRGFESVQEMNEKILNNIKSIVTQEDTLYILGDVVMGKITDAVELLKQIPGHVIVIRGNHDSDIKVEFYKELGWEVRDAAYLTANHIHFFLCHYPTIVAEYPKPLKNTMFCLHGHTHSRVSISEWTNNIHVGIDSFECYPISLDSIVRIIYADSQRPADERMFEIND